MSDKPKPSDKDVIDGVVLFFDMLRRGQKKIKEGVPMKTIQKECEAEGDGFLKELSDRGIGFVKCENNLAKKNCSVDYVFADDEDNFIQVTILHTHIPKKEQLAHMAIAKLKSSLEDDSE